MKKVGIGLLVLCVALFGVGWLRLYRYLHTPGGAGPAVELRVAPGTSLGELTTRLAQVGLISRPRWLYYYARARGLTDVKAGDYELAPSETPLAILDKLRAGQVRLTRVTIPEGLNAFEIAGLLEQAGVTSAAGILALCQDARFVAQLELPGPTCEGYLFPETYRLRAGSAPAEVLAVMVREFKQAFGPELLKAGAQRGLTARDVVTLASIIQKETGVVHEMGRISSVFHNRLARGMRLQTDPTVLYVEWLTTGRSDRNITRADLQRDHPYNTYTRGGIPPGPIASPGRAALRAAVAPDTTSDLYFVSKNNGEHEFCPTLQCHNQAVQRWQIEYFPRGAARAGGQPGG